MNHSKNSIIDAARLCEYVGLPIYQENYCLDMPCYYSKEFKKGLNNKKEILILINKNNILGSCSRHNDNRYRVVLEYPDISCCQKIIRDSIDNYFINFTFKELSKVYDLLIYG